MRKISIQAVSPGQYSACFLGVEDSLHPKCGPGWRFWFKIVDGNFSGLKVARTTPPASTAGNITGRLLAGLAGRPLIAGEEVDADEFIGSRYVIEVGLNDEGKPRVISVRPENID
jgi:hypothetical protein